MPSENCPHSFDLGLSFGIVGIEPRGRFEIGERVFRVAAILVDDGPPEIGVG